MGRLRWSGVLGGSAAVILTAAATGLARDSRVHRPIVSISGAAVSEPETGSTTAGFAVRLSSPSRVTVSVRFATADGTATANEDYVPTHGTLVFKPGQRSKRVNVQVLGDTTPEGAERFFVQLSGPRNARLGADQASAAIAGSDLPGAFTVTATLTGFPGAGSGRATLTLDPAAEQGTFEIVVNGSPEDPSAEHLHSRLDQSLTIGLLPVPTRNGRTTGAFVLTQRLILQIWSSPHDYDIQVHTPNAAYTLDGFLGRS